MSTSDRPAQAYAAITREVVALIHRHSGNDIERAAYMVMRAALIELSLRKGNEVAASKSYALADEFAAGIGR